MHGLEEVQYHVPELETILGDTYGICVSGDSLVIDARTGQRYRLDEVGALADFVIQGVDEQWRPAMGRVSHWVDSGHKPVFRVTLRNGAQIKVTADHRLLTEAGWRPLCELQVGDYIGTPSHLIGPASEETARRLNTVWEEIITIEPAGVEHVYDLTVEGLHSLSPTTSSSITASIRSRLSRWQVNWRVMSRVKPT
ncbi:MAG: hypothetical protein V9G20_02465 [Candidatus Promineifilaceae bacterium]